MHAPLSALPRKLLALFLACLLPTAGCVPGELLIPEPGVPQYRQLGLVPVPGGFVNAAGGNLVAERLDLSIDTILGTWEIRAHYDSAGSGWLWSFQVSYDGGSFLDPTGATYDVSALADGDPIPGTVWIKVDADTIETKGGLGYHFDPQGRLDHVAWRSGAYPRIQYTWSAGSLEMASCTAVDLCLAFYTVALNAAGRPLSVTDARTGRVADFSYDVFGRLEVARTALEVAEDRPGTRYEYAPWSWRLTALTNAEGERIEYVWAAAGRIWRVVQMGEEKPWHEFRFRARDADGLYSTLHINPLGGQTLLFFDRQRRLRRVERTDAGETVQYTWSGLRPSAIVLPGGVATAFTWAGDDLATLTEPSGNVVELTPAPGALNLEDPFAPPLARIEDSLGLVEDRTYDAQGRLENVTNGESETVHVNRGAIVVDSITNAAGLTWSFPFYGVHGHWLEVQGATEDKRAFDPVGNATATSAGSQEGGVLTRGYDADRHLTTLNVAATEAGSVVSQDAVTVTYRSDGRMEYVARPHGADHDFAYDTIGRLVEQREKVDGVWQATVFESDRAGNLTARERPNGMREEWDYDVYGRVTHHRALRDGVLEGEAVTTWQDGRPASYTDSLRGTPEVYGYDAAGRLQTVLFGYGETLTLEHDLRSRRTAEIYALPGQGEIRRLDYEYDLANRRVRTTADGSELLLESVYTNGQLDLTRYGNGLERDSQYDPVTGDLVGTTTTNAASQVVEQTDIVRGARQDPVRFAVEVDTTTPLATTREEYWLGIGGSLGSPDLLVGKRVWHWTDGAGSDREFVYDELSNQVDNGAGDVFAYNAEQSRLLQASLAATGETVTYTYDAAGYADSRNGLPITWTATGRLVSYDDVAIEWDLRGRPIAITAAGLTREFVYFGGAVDSDPDTGALGALDLGVVQLPFGSSARLYRHRDFRGNVSFVTDETGAVVTHYHYSAYGVKAVYGVQVDAHTFVGGQEIGALMILGARIYDPAVGRFLSPDPVFELLNPYSYTFGNPVFYWDPDGAKQSLAELEQAYADAVFEAEIAAAAFVIALGLVIGALAVGGPVGAVAVGLRSSALVLAFIVLANRLENLRKAGEALKAAGGAPPSIPAPGLPSLSFPQLPDFGSGPCTSRCTNPSDPGPQDAIPGITNFSAAPGAGSCAPTHLEAVPALPWALALLLPLQLLLAILVLQRRRSETKRSHRRCRTA
jgi:RHS repeat-associated protein